MSWSDPHSIDRTGKLLLDAGRAESPQQAEEILGRLVLQVAVGPGIEDDPAAQAALATVVNAGVRAFRGGVAVRAEDDPILTEGWVTGRRLSTAVEELGGTIIRELSLRYPTVVIGDPIMAADGEVVLWTTWQGWVGGVVEDPGNRLVGRSLAIAGVLAGGLAVAEMFQHVVELSKEAARRDVGLSLWRPDLPWRHPIAVGPDLGWLPAALWLLGLGHLGQGYGWSLGWLPYKTPVNVTINLMDTDFVVAGNRATGLLLRETDVGTRKTRVISARLEGELGFKTAIVERRFDQGTRISDMEPLLGLAGFDNPESRRLLGHAGFGLVLDGGLGRGPREFLDIQIHSFPSQTDSADAFPDNDRASSELGEPYAAEVERRVAAGETVADATCGVIEVAGITAAAAFVGAVTGALVIGAVLRHLHDGKQLAVLSVDLRSPQYVDTAENAAEIAGFNPGTTPPRQRS